MEGGESDSESEWGGEGGGEGGGGEKKKTIKRHKQSSHFHEN